MNAQEPKKDIALECIRGVAALNVLLWHLFNAFLPAKTGFYANFPNFLSGSIRITPLFVFMNGTGAVTIFFVLSGYVLTRRSFLTNDRSSILRGAIKRLPRLAGPVTVAVLFSWLLFTTHAYRFAEAGTVAHSPWLSTFAWATQDWKGHVNEHFKVGFLDALAQGTFLTFVRGDDYYDTVLWTMKYEFYGSLISFALASFIILMGDRRRLVSSAVFAPVIALCALIDPFYVAFPAGVMLAFLLPPNTKGLPLRAAIPLVLLSLYLLGYSGVSMGVFSPIPPIFGSVANQTFVLIFASVLLLFVVESSGHLKSILSSKIGAMVGWLSFPLYLIHVPIMCSAGAIIFLVAQSFGMPATVLAFVATIALSMLCAIPLAIFNDRWVYSINAAVGWLLAKQQFPVNYSKVAAHSEQVENQSDQIDRPSVTGQT